LDNSSSDLNKQILTVSLVPLVVLSLIFASYFIWSQTSANNNALIKQGNTVAKLVAIQAKDAIKKNNTNHLAQISSLPLELDDVSDAVFLDKRFQILVRSKSFPLALRPTAPSNYFDQPHWYFVQPILAPNQPTSLFRSHSSKIDSSQIIGWVIIVVSNQSNQQKNLNLALTVIAIFAAALSLVYWGVRRFTKQTVAPIAEISAVLEAFQKGNFDARARESHAGKLHNLASGINRMAVRIKASTTDMETRVDSATRRLQSAMHHLEQQNETLESTREKEIEANQAKDQFLARMSHELRTPLTSVLGFSKILQETDITAEQAEPIRIINHTSQLLLSIVDDILDYSKLQKNAITLERIDFNLETAILDILEMQAPMAHSKGLELSLACKNGRSYEIKGDPTRFKQIITNLVSNAIKFTDSGSVAINADVQYINTHQSLIIISVTDTGIGISDEQLNKLFKAFVQADTSITRRFGGSGLGLVIAKTLTKLMGGKLEIYSKQQRGTNVTLQIPTLSNNHYQEPKKTLLVDSSAVLIYEENQHARRSMALLLERTHHQHRSISNIDDFFQLMPNYQHLIVGINPKDAQNKLIKSILKKLNDQHTIVTFALPNGHPLPSLPKVVNIINKPIRPYCIIPSLQNQKADKLTAESDYQQNNNICAVVAEDNAFNQILISRILEKNNISCHIADNGKEAIALITKHNPNIAIIDIHMPIMDGFEATKIIRKNSDMPIISLTANIIEQDHQKILSAGSNCIVLKPINDLELIRRIREFTKIDQATGQLNTLPVVKEDSHQTSTDNIELNQPATNIVDYQLDQSILKAELCRLLQLLNESFRELDNKKMRGIAHQLVGLAGLYELPEVELATIDLQEKLKETEIKEIWYRLFRLNRLIEGTETLASLDAD
jgi:two-component system sensor histidine kinase BarA